MTAQKKQELINLAVPVLIFLAPVIMTVLLGVSSWTLLAVVDLREGVTRLATASDYDRRDYVALKEQQKADAAVHASIWAQLQDLRDQQYRHGWNEK